jgi:hypothetical protein
MNYFIKENKLNCGGYKIRNQINGSKLSSVRCEATRISRKNEGIAEGKINKFGIKSMFKILETCMES